MFVTFILFIFFFAAMPENLSFFLNEIFLVRQEFCAVLVGFLNFYIKNLIFWGFIFGYSLNFCKSDII